MHKAIGVSRQKFIPRSTLADLRNAIRKVKSLSPEVGIPFPQTNFKRAAIAELPASKKVLAEIEKSNPLAAKQLSIVLWGHPHEAATAINKLLSEKRPDKRLLPLYRTLILDSSPMVRDAAIHAVSVLGRPKDLPMLAKGMYDPDYRVRASTILIFGTIAQRYPQVYPFLLKKFDRVQKVRNFGEFQDMKILKSAVVMAGQAPKEFELYFDDALNPEFNELSKRSIVRNDQFKDGSRTVLLGGKLYKKAMVRVIDRESLTSWVKLSRLGIPVEPLLYKEVTLKDGRKARKLRVHRNKDGTYSVSVGVINGVSLSTFIRLKENHRHFNEIMRQVKEIKAKLAASGVIHGHAHPGNYVASMENGKPKVYLIDFDQAKEKYETDYQI
jgi:hypothetical protein